MIKTKAYAKINLGLKILDKRDDGFHNIETTFSTIDLADHVVIEPIPRGIEIHCPALKIAPEDNTCYRAAKIIFGRAGVAQGVKVNIQKRIPVGGGLGGGSSDAAAVLLGMNQLFNLNMSEEEIMKVARDVGCDVPFFIKGGAAYARGVGDELKFFKLPKMSLVLYYPGYPISTKWAYEAYDKKVLTAHIEMPDIDNKKKKRRTGFQLMNDFEEVVFQAHPDLLDVKAHLLASGALMSSLSGSGSCLFVVVDDSTRKKVLKYLDSISAIYFEVETV